MDGWPAYGPADLRFPCQQLFTVSIPSCWFRLLQKRSWALEIAARYSGWSNSSLPLPALKGGIHRTAGAGAHPQPSQKRCPHCGSFLLMRMSHCFWNQPQQPHNRRGRTLLFHPCFHKYIRSQSWLDRDICNGGDSRFAISSITQIFRTGPISAATSRKSISKNGKLYPAIFNRYSASIPTRLLPPFITAHALEILPYYPVPDGSSPHFPVRTGIFRLVGEEPIAQITGMRLFHLNQFRSCRCIQVNLNSRSFYLGCCGKAWPPSLPVAGRFPCQQELSSQMIAAFINHRSGTSFPLISVPPAFRRFSRLRWHLPAFIGTSSSGWFPNKSHRRISQTCCVRWAYPDWKSRHSSPGRSPHRLRCPLFS